MSVIERSGRDDGFSLAEVLVGLMLTSILIAAMVVLASQFRSYINANDRIEQLMELHAVARKIAKVIEQAEALPVIRNSSGQDQFLIGQPDKIMLVTTLKLGVHRSGLRDVSIMRDIQKGLVMEAGFHRPAKPRGADSSPIVIELLNGDVSVRFQYFNGSAADGRTQWVENWDVPARLPDGVQVQVTKNVPGGTSLTASAFAAMWMN